MKSKGPWAEYCTRPGYDTESLCGLGISIYVFGSLCLWSEVVESINSEAFIFLKFNDPKFLGLLNT